MVSIRIKAFTFFFILLLVRYSNALVGDEDEVGRITVKKDVYNGLTKSVELTSMRLKGRKILMSPKESPMIVKAEKDDSLTKNSLPREASRHENGVLDVEQSLRNRSPFTAFTADYNVPKPHPPKHN
ncbi:hypothetical protein ACFE04_006742 [Oxalis oulophora]